MVPRYHINKGRNERTKMIKFKSNEEITDKDIDQIHNYTISLYDEITNGGYKDVDKTRVKNRIRHLIEIVEKDEQNESVA